jgi:hypothetical protein
MSSHGRRRKALIASSWLLGVAALTGSLLLARALRASHPEPLPDFANQKAIYEPAIGAQYTFSGADAALLRPGDLGAGLVLRQRPSRTPAGRTDEGAPAAGESDTRTRGAMEG